MKKVVVITGASSGIGAATARALAKDNNLVLAARREERLQELVKELASPDNAAEYKVTDVSHPEQMEALAQFAVEQFGRIDVWINNAGYMAQSWLKNKRLEEWNQTIDTNLKGTLYGIAAALPYMREQKSGQIINVCSVAGFNVIFGSAVYSGTKYAVRAISECLRQELAADHDNIRVTTIYPGATETEVYSSINDPAMKQLALEYFKENGAIPPERIAQVIKNAIELPEDCSLNDVVVRPNHEVW